MKYYNQRWSGKETNLFRRAGREEKPMRNETDEKKLTWKEGAKKNRKHQYIAGIAWWKNENKNNKYVQLFMHTNKSHTCALIDTRAFHATEPFNKRSTYRVYIHKNWIKRASKKQRQRKTNTSTKRENDKKLVFWLMKKKATTAPAPIVQQSIVKLWYEQMKML